MPTQEEFERALREESNNQRKLTVLGPFENNPAPCTKYPELEAHARKIADTACRAINEAAARAESAMPYKAQHILEELIKILQKRV